MRNIDHSMAAGLALKRLIQCNYSSQQAFAEDFGTELRTVSRYVTNGITRMPMIEEIADFFHMDLIDYLRLGREISEEMCIRE